MVIDFLCAGTFSRIHTIVYLDAEAGEDELEALHQQVLETSPVGSILTRPVEVTTELRARQADQAA